MPKWGNLWRGGPQTTLHHRSGKCDLCGREGVLKEKMAADVP